MNLKVFTAFSGYDSQCMALDRLHEHNPHFHYELVGWAEIDKYAIQAHNAVYPQWADRNYGDISRIDWQQVPDFDLFTYSSPCQDFSQAGKQAGGTEGSGTRSSLLWECRRAILAKKPKYLLMENVAALVSQKFIRLFNAWQLELESYGYRNFAKVLNAKDYGVPQNRERIFMVSILDESARYEFPQPMPLTLRLKDVLEDKVDERYFMKDAKLLEILETMDAMPSEDMQVLGWVRDAKGIITHRPVVDVANAVTSGKRDNTQNYVIEPTPRVIAMIDSAAHELVRRVYSREGIAPTLNCCEGGNLQPKILEPSEIKDLCVGDIPYRIRKLTERECFRLMDVPEAYIDRIQQAGISRSQQYKMAGNSIVVSCMYHIWRRLWIDTHITNLTLF